MLYSLYAVFQLKFNCTNCIKLSSNKSYNYSLKPHDYLPSLMMGVREWATINVWQ